MICRIHGRLEAISNGKAIVDLTDGLTYEVLLPAFAEARLGPQIGQPVTLHTLHYMEGSAQGANFTPRLAGFLTETDRAFFELFTSVKGIGARKALRCMTLETGQVAGAIADRDAKLLQSLPEVGKRLAETVIATLHGKVNAFVSGAVYGQADRGAEAAAASTPRRAAVREALDVLLDLDESRSDAVALIDRVLAEDPDLDSAQDIINAVFRAKAGA